MLYKYMRLYLREDVTGNSVTLDCEIDIDENLQFVQIEPHIKDALNIGDKIYNEGWNVEDLLMYAEKMGFSYDNHIGGFDE